MFFVEKINKIAKINDIFLCNYANFIHFKFFSIDKFTSLWLNIYIKIHFQKTMTETMSLLKATESRR